MKNKKQDEHNNMKLYGATLSQVKQTKGFKFMNDFYLVTILTEMDKKDIFSLYQKHGFVYLEASPFRIKEPIDNFELYVKGYKYQPVIAYIGKENCVDYMSIIDGKVKDEEGSVPRNVIVLLGVEKAVREAMEEMNLW